MALSKLIPLFLVLVLQNTVHSQVSTSFSFNSFAPNPTYLTYQGGTHVPNDAPILRLTATDSNSSLGRPLSWWVGRVVYSSPVLFWESSPPTQATFETTIRFTITPTRISPWTGVGDGIAFFIAPVGTNIPGDSAGGHLGLFNSSGTASSLFAVEFDNYVNQWDPNHRHIGININSRESRTTVRFDSAGFGRVVTATIRYNALTRTINVAASSDSWQTATLSYVFDLKTVLPKQVQVGISSATGELWLDNGIHDIRSWSFSSFLVRTEDVTYNDDSYIRPM